MIKITKLKQIDESETRTNNILKDPKFTSWFNGSKVVDSNGNPLVCYHGTRTKFSNFATLSHFGTINASSSFVSSDPIVFDWFDKRKDQIIPVYLSIKNPLKIEDNESSAKELGFDLYFQKLISWEEFLEVYPTFYKIVKVFENKIKDKDKRSLSDIQNNIHDYSEYYHGAYNKTKLISIFKQKGYDGFVYENNIEDTGSTSWIIFNSNQVWPIYQNKPDRNSERKR